MYDPVVRYDCLHDSFEVHTYNSDDSESMHEISAPEFDPEN